MVPHDRLFLDALERDLKREKMGLELMTVVTGEPALSFTYDPKRSLYEQFAKSSGSREGEGEGELEAAVRRADEAADTSGESDRQSDAGQSSSASASASDTDELQGQESGPRAGKKGGSRRGLMAAATKNMHSLFF